MLLGRYRNLTWNYLNVCLSGLEAVVYFFFSLPYSLDRERPAKVDFCEGIRRNTITRPVNPKSKQLNISTDRESINNI